MKKQTQSAQYPSTAYNPLNYCSIPLATDTHEHALTTACAALNAVSDQLKALPVIADRRVDLPTVEALPSIRRAIAFLDQAIIAIHTNSNEGIQQ